ncbi:MAG TPA: hypothetical protein VN289_00075 [Paraburkholderia sp.]|jgi:hypothetical protein|nr:hypothetical protein [Paraburkholderia sp.]
MRHLSKRRPLVARGAAPFLLAAIASLLVTLFAAPDALAAQGVDGTVSAVAILVYHRFSDSSDDSMTVRMTTFEAFRAIACYGRTSSR